jgi:DNA-binding NarL/FixJ family response regulator
MSDPPAGRLAVIDHHPLFVSGLALLLPELTGGRISVVGSTSDAAAATSLVRRCVPDLALVDLHLPPPGGIRAVAAIRRATPRLRIIAMSGPDEPVRALDALRAGAEGCLFKNSEAAELIPPLLAAVNGWTVLPTELLGALLGQTPRQSSVIGGLDGEERRLLRLIAGGRQTVDIAEELHVSERTVKRLTAALLRKLRVSSRTQAAALAGSAGLT